MNEAIKQWNQESHTAKTVKKSDILEYLAFSYYSQVNVRLEIFLKWDIKYKLILCILNLDYSFWIQDDIRRALHYTNQLLELEPDHPRAVGNKWYYEEALGDDGVVDDALNRRRGI